MIEKINLGDSFFKEVVVTEIIDDEETPVNLSIYDDNYVAIKKSRSDIDSDAYIIKRVFVSDAQEGILTLNLTPDETATLPITTPDGIQSLLGFVQIGSSITGQVHEVSSFKIKTKESGIRHITEIDKSYDMGCIGDLTGWVFDAGRLCEQTLMIVDFDSENMGVLMYNAGSISSTELIIYDFGIFDTTMPTIVDMGPLRECSYSLSCITS